jgi:hypothetical protein
MNVCDVRFNVNPFITFITSSGNCLTRYKRYERYKRDYFLFVFVNLSRDPFITYGLFEIDAQTVGVYDGHANHISQFQANFVFAFAFWQEFFRTGFAVVNKHGLRKFANLFNEFVHGELFIYL